MKVLFAAVHESDPGPSRHLPHCSDTSGVGAQADVVNGRLQPRHTSFIGGDRRSRSGSLVSRFAPRLGAGKPG
jgi:hypothetical protein